jgi:cation transport regulator ChaC
MALVFQYGSNMSVDRLNSKDRLAGDAKTVCVAKTIEPFELVFSVWSKSNDCAAADLLPSKAGRNIYGVLYEVPAFLIGRDVAKQKGRKSLDAIEGEGTNYVREMIDLVTNDGASIRAITYLAKNRQPNLKTSKDYVAHILKGIREHSMPVEYYQYVRSKIIENNGDLEDLLPTRMPDV